MLLSTMKAPEGGKVMTFCSRCALTSITCAKQQQQRQQQQQQQLGGGGKFSMKVKKRGGAEGGGLGGLGGGLGGGWSHGSLQPCDSGSAPHV
jgi:hypothetical protein